MEEQDMSSAEENREEYQANIAEQYRIEYKRTAGHKQSRIEKSNVEYNSRAQQLKSRTIEKKKNRRTEQEESGIKRAVSNKRTRQQHKF